jgi:outer membrane biosynthesis protein TonB
MVRYDRRKGAQQEETLSREPLAKWDLPVWREIPIMLAAKLYGAGRLSSERAAKLAGISHVEFFFSLGFYKVFPLQTELNELEKQYKQKKEQTEGAKKAEPAKQTGQEKQPVHKKQAEQPKQEKQAAGQTKPPQQVEPELSPEPAQAGVQVEKK